MPNINLLCVAYNTSSTIMMCSKIQLECFRAQVVRIGQKEDTLK